MKRRRRPHGPSCRHCPRVRLLGLEFRSWRHAWELDHDRAGAGYAAEQADHRASSTPPTFGAYLVAMTGSGWPMSGSRP